jgi:hypothetical protein
MTMCLGCDDSRDMLVASVPPLRWPLVVVPGERRLQGLEFLARSPQWKAILLARGSTVSLLKAALDLAS